MMTEPITLTILPWEVQEERFKVYTSASKSWSSTMEYNVTNLRAAERYANDLLSFRGHVILNDVYDIIELPRTRIGMVVGWLRDETVEFRSVVSATANEITLRFNFKGVIYDSI